MKKLIALTALLQLFTTTLVFAQKFDLASIIPSSAPAFTILGTSPTEISKPNNWSALQTQITQNFTSNNQAVIPKNLALEFAPFWLANHPNFTYDDYLKTNGFSMRNLKISLATSTVPYGADSVQGMGFGFRIPIQTSNKKALQTAQQLNQYITQQRTNTTQGQALFMAYTISYAGATVGSFLADLKTNLATPPNAMWTTHANLIKAIKDTLDVAFADKTSDTFTTDLQDILTCIKEYCRIRNTAVAADITKQISQSLKDVAPWEVAGAFSLMFPTSQFSYSKPGKLGLWTDYSFELDQQATWEGTIAARYVHSWAVDTIAATNSGDLLGRLSVNMGESQKFSLSGWVLLRRQWSSTKSIVVNNERYYNEVTTWDNKYGVDISYKVSNSVAFAYSFGKGYGADPFSLPKLRNQLISFLSIYYSINTKAEKAGDKFLLKSL